MTCNVFLPMFRRDVFFVQQHLRLCQRVPRKNYDPQRRRWRRVRADGRKSFRFFRIPLCLSQVTTFLMMRCILIETPFVPIPGVVELTVYWIISPIMGILVSCIQRVCFREHESEFFVLRNPECLPFLWSFSTSSPKILTREWGCGDI